MQDGESSAGIEEFLSEWVAECSNETAAVASLDFSAIMGVAGPRDGVHRPVLLDVAATRPARSARTRSRATRARGGRSRAAAQPVGVVDLLPTSEAGGSTATKESQGGTAAFTEHPELRRRGTLGTYTRVLTPHGHAVELTDKHIDAATLS